MNKIHVGGGTLKEFRMDYTEINETNGKVCKASQIFPILNRGYNVTKDNEELEALYEWVIYYEDNQTNKDLFKKVPDAKPENDLMI